MKPAKRKTPPALRGHQFGKGGKKSSPKMADRSMKKGGK